MSINNIDIGWYLGNGLSIKEMNGWRAYVAEPTYKLNVDSFISDDIFEKKIKEGNTGGMAEMTKNKSAKIFISFHPTEPLIMLSTYLSLIHI